MKKENNQEIVVLIGNKGYVDFEIPVLMSKEQKSQFFQLLNRIFDKRIVQKRDVPSFERDWRVGDRVLYFRTWEPEEYAILLESDTIQQGVESLGRSWQACELKDADWRYKLVSFCDKYGHDLSKSDKLQIIKEFMKTQEAFKKNRKLLRKERRELEQELAVLRSPKKKNQIDFFQRIGKITNEDIEKLVKKEQEILLRISEIDGELGKDITDF